MSPLVASTPPATADALRKSRREVLFVSSCMIEPPGKVDDFGDRFIVSRSPYRKPCVRILRALTDESGRCLLLCRGAQSLHQLTRERTFFRLSYSSTARTTRKPT